MNPISFKPFIDGARRGSRHRASPDSSARSLRGGDQGEQLQPGHAGRLDDLAGAHRRTAGGQHRVDQQGQRDPRPRRGTCCNTPSAAGSPRRGYSPMCQTSASGKSSMTPSAIPRPARRIGTIPTTSVRTRAGRRPSGVVTSRVDRSAGRPSPPARAARRACAPAGETPPDRCSHHVTMQAYVV